MVLAPLWLPGGISSDDAHYPPDTTYIAPHDENDTLLKSVDSLNVNTEEDGHVDAPQQAHESKLTAHEEAINFLGKWFEAHKVESKKWLEDTQAKFETLQDAYNSWCSIIGLLEDRIQRNASNIEAAIQGLQKKLESLGKNLTSLQENFDNRDSTISSLKELIQVHNYNLKAAVELLQDNSLSASDTVRKYGSCVRLLADDIKEIHDVYIRPFQKQIDELRTESHNHTIENQLLNDEIAGLKTALNKYAQDNESLKGEIRAQRSEITALKDNGWALVLRYSNLLNKIDSLEDKIGRINHAVRTRDESTK